MMQKTDEFVTHQPVLNGEYLRLCHALSSQVSFNPFYPRAKNPSQESGLELLPDVFGEKLPRPGARKRPDVERLTVRTGTDLTNFF